METKRKRITKRKDNRVKTAFPTEFEPRFWENGDRRIAVVRQILNRYENLKRDAGGENSTQRDLLIQRACFLSCILESQEIEAAEGGHFEIGSYTQGCNALLGLLRALGLEKQAKDVLDLDTYVNRKNGRKRK